MKRLMKKMICMVIMLTLLINVSTITKASADVNVTDKAYTSLPTKETITTGEITTIRIGVGSSAESISNIKSKNKNLKAKLYVTCTDSTSGGKWYLVHLYSKKSGIYKAAYTYTDANGKQIKKTLKVKVTKEEPFKYVKLKGKKLSSDTENIVKANKAKLSIKMNNGYKLKKIQIVKYKYDSTGNTIEVTTKVKNNSKITISSTPYTDVTRNNDSSIRRYVDSIDAETYIVITYKDKYSKKNKTITYTLIKRLV